MDFRDLMFFMNRNLLLKYGNAIMDIGRQNGGNKNEIL